MTIKEDGCYSSDSSAEVARVILYAASGEEGPLDPLSMPVESLKTAEYDYLGGSLVQRGGATFRAIAPGGRGVLGAFNGLVTFRCGFPGLVPMKDHSPCCGAVVVVAMKTAGTVPRLQPHPPSHSAPAQ